MDNFLLCTHPVNNGVMFTFPNGYMVSIRWGTANYCDNRFTEGVTDSCANAEVAIMDKNGNIIGDVYSRVGTLGVLKLMNKAANMETN